MYQSPFAGLPEKQKNEKNKKLKRPLATSLAYSSTRRKFAILGQFEYSLKWPFSEMCRTRQTCRHSPSRLPSTRQTRRHLPKAIFEKNVNLLAKFARVMSESCKFGVSSRCLMKN
jgi:hypothetical protein